VYALNPNHVACFDSFARNLEREATVFLPNPGSVTRPAEINIDPEPARVFDPQGEKIVYFRPLWSRFVSAAIIVFLLDLLIRRVRLFDRKFLPRRSFPPPPRA